MRNFIYEGGRENKPITILIEGNGQRGKAEEYGENRTTMQIIMIFFIDKIYVYKLLIRL